MRGDIFLWTKHSRAKMSFYGLSESRIKRIIRHPQRIEKGIAPGTIASMQTAGSKKHPYEIWVMYQIKKQDAEYQQLKNRNQKQKEKEPKTELAKSSKRSKIVIISAWKYPGITKPGDPIPIPPDIFQELIQRLPQLK